MPVIIFLADLLLKSAALKNLSEERDSKAGPLRLRLVRNRGAFMNLGERAPRLVAALSVIMTGFLIPAYISEAVIKGRPKSPMGIALGALLGGALSNTSDRLKRGYVVDYIGCPGTHYYYNIGDVGIIAGAMLFVLECMKERN